MAVKAAIKVTQAVRLLNLEHRETPLPRIGIGTGTGFSKGNIGVGDMGSHDKCSEIVIGDAFKLGSQLERVSKIYAVEIVAGATTRQQAQGFSWQELDGVGVKGKIDAVYLPLPQPPLEPAQMALHSDTEIGDELTVWAVPL